MKLQIMILPLVAFCASSRLAQAEHAKITLEARTRANSVTAHVDQTPPEWGKNPRPVLKLKAGETLRIQCIYTNVYPHKTLENMVVHLYVARIKRVGQRALPDLSDLDNVVLETAFDLDLKPGKKAGQQNRIKLDEPGVYLLRVESRNSGSDHEHFSAIDLVVEDGNEPESPRTKTPATGDSKPADRASKP